MPIRSFICGSSTILAGWLLTTYFYQVPAQSYPQKMKTTATKPPVVEREVAKLK